MTTTVGLDGVSVTLKPNDDSTDKRGMTVTASEDSGEPFFSQDAVPLVFGWDLAKMLEDNGATIGDSSKQIEQFRQETVEAFFAGAEQASEKQLTFKRLGGGAVRVVMELGPEGQDGKSELIVPLQIAQDIGSQFLKINPDDVQKGALKVLRYILNARP